MVRGSIRRGLPAPLALMPGLGLLVACSIDSDPPVDEEYGSTHALITVERTESVDGASTRAEALAGFVHVPPLVDPVSAMNLVGLGLDLPAFGECTHERDSEATAPLSETARVEFVPAGNGDVSLEVGGAKNELAPHAFPTVTDSISGVLYTTRDRQSASLAASSAYTVTADGLGLRISATSPASLEGVTAGGTPLDEMAELSLAHPLDLTWSVGQPGDIVYVEVTSDSSRHTVCSFADEIGAGSVPLDHFESGQSGRVALHRVHSAEFDLAIGGQPGRGQLRFDFALTAGVKFD